MRVTKVLTRQTAAAEIQERLSNSSQTQIEIMMVALTRMIFFRLRSQSEERALFSDFGLWQKWPPYRPMTLQRRASPTVTLLRVISVMLALRRERRIIRVVGVKRTRQRVERA